MFFHSCETRDPWPPEKPDSGSFCPPITPESRTDLTKPPPSAICTEVTVEDFEPFGMFSPDTWMQWWGCYSKADRIFRNCELAGGGRYPIKLSIEKRIIWEKEVDTCTMEYQKTEGFSFDPSANTLPDFLAVVGVSEGAGPPGGGGID